MMKKIYIILILLYLGNDNLWSQSVDQNKNEISNFSHFAKEKMFVHYNSSMFFVGEYIFYKVYCFKKSTNLLSDLSKIAYIELIGQDNKVVFRHKLVLEKGESYGDFFIPETVPSGNYKIIAYTNWMKNHPHSFFNADIVIINPYQANQEALLPRNLKDPSLVITHQVQPQHEIKNSSSSNEVELNLNKKTYWKRDSVSITINIGNPEFEMGNYSLSVRRLNSFQIPQKKSSISFTQNTESRKVNTDYLNSKVYLPELRGELIFGKIESNIDSLPIENQNIAFSLSGKNSLLRIVKTDKRGAFIVNVDTSYLSNKALLQVLGSNKGDYTIFLDKLKENDYSHLQFYNDFVLTPKLQESIIARSVHNQIENAFFSYRSDSVAAPLLRKPFKKSMLTAYDLDDFERFSSLKETFVEIINHSWITKLDQENSVFEIRLHEKYRKREALPLLIVDGIVVEDHNELLNYNARNLKRISIVRDEYVFGIKSYKGVIVFETINDDYSSLANNISSNEIELFAPQPKKKYFKQVHSQKASTIDRLPDDRSQLLWMPMIPLKKGNNTIDIYTSDVEGDFEINLEGFSSVGKPLSITKRFSVKYLKKEDGN